jgi:iron complex outermembrane receptor protein
MRQQTRISLKLPKRGDGHAACLNKEALLMGSRNLRSQQCITAAVLAAIYGTRAFADAPGDAPAVENENMLQEVTVTASRHAVSAEDLPLSITAVSGASLEAAGIQDISALAKSMAGVDYTDKGPFSGVSGSNLIIRGLNSETTSGAPAGASPVPPPVATYVDDTPLFVNLRLQDLDHVEVLRGPQGTLYGSGSLGGTIRFVQNAPDPGGFDGKIEAGMSDTKHTHAPNEDVSGMINIPITSTFAIRANAGLANDAGFINQPNLYALDGAGVPIPAQPGNLFSPPEIIDKKGVNSYQYRNARISALWKPTEAFKAQFSYYYQTGSAAGYPYIATNLTGYNTPINPANLPVGTFTPPAVTQLYNLPLPSGIDQLSSPENFADTTKDVVNLAALTLEYDLGFATLTSATSWARHANNTVADETAEYENFPSFPQDLYGQNPRMLVVGEEAFVDKPWSEELRIVSKSGGFFDYVGGLFYEHQVYTIMENDFFPGYDAFYNACSPTFGTSPGDFVTPSICGVGNSAVGQTVNGVPIVPNQLFVGNIKNTYKDMAAFGELTEHFTKAWSVTEGLRVFKQTLTQSQQNALTLLADPIYDTPPTNLTSSGSWSRALGKVNTSYQLDANNLVYFTWSQGFRHGAINALPSSAGGLAVPASIAKATPDTANNFEIGAKGTINNQFRYSAAIYDIQWKNVQEEVSLTPIVLPGVLNIGNAYSRGVELEFDNAWTQHLSTNVSYTFDKTSLTSITPLWVSPLVVGTVPAVGSPLPGTPKNSVAGGFDYGHIPLFGGQVDFAADAHYQSSETSALSASIPIVGGYPMFNAHLSYSISHFIVTAFVNNLTNNLGISAYQDPASQGNRYLAIVSQPRTIGGRISYSFK